VGLEEGPRGESPHNHLHRDHLTAQRAGQVHTRAHTHTRTPQTLSVVVFLPRASPPQHKEEEGGGRREERGSRYPPPEAVGSLLAKVVGGQSGKLEQAEHAARGFVGQTTFALDHIPLLDSPPISHASPMLPRLHESNPDLSVLSTLSSQSEGKIVWGRALSPLPAVIESFERTTT